MFLFTNAIGFLCVRVLYGNEVTNKMRSYRRQQMDQITENSMEEKKKENRQPF